MPQAQQQAQQIIFLDKPTPSLQVILDHITPKQMAASSFEPANDKEPELSESYIREISPFFDKETSDEVEAQLDLLAGLGEHEDLPSELLKATVAAPPMPLVHPILNPETELRYPEVLPPPQCSLLLWWWLAITCSW